MVTCSLQPDTAATTGVSPLAVSLRSKPILDMLVELLSGHPMYSSELARRLLQLLAGCRETVPSVVTFPSYSLIVPLTAQHLMRSKTRQRKAKAC